MPFGNQFIFCIGRNDKGHSVWKEPLKRWEDFKTVGGFFNLLASQTKGRCFQEDVDDQQDDLFGLGRRLLGGREAACGEYGTPRTFKTPATQQENLWIVVDYEDGRFL